MIKRIREELLKNKDEQTAYSYNKYFKNVIQFYGIKTPKLKQILNELYKEIKKLSFDEQLQLSQELIKSKYSEEKSIALGILAKNIKNLDETHLPIIKELFDYVNNWATCDSLSGQLLCEMIKKGKLTPEKMSEWKNSSNLWMQRAACVTFVKIAKTGRYNKIILNICDTTIKNPERFVQLGTGWVLRELSLADLDLVISFIKQNYSHISREGLRYATEKMTPELKKELMNYNNIQNL